MTPLEQELCLPSFLPLILLAPTLLTITLLALTLLPLTILPLTLLAWQGQLAQHLDSQGQCYLVVVFITCPCLCSPIPREVSISLAWRSWPCLNKHVAHLLPVASLPEGLLLQECLLQHLQLGPEIRLQEDTLLEVAVFECLIRSRLYIYLCSLRKRVIYLPLTITKNGMALPTKWISYCCHSRVL